MLTTDLTQFILWMIYSGGSIIVASWLLEHIPKFVALASEAKSLITKAVSVALALGFYAILTYVPAATMSALAPWFAIAAGTVLTHSAGQVVHKLTKV
jgi:hypothetical protein